MKHIKISAILLIAVLLIGMSIATANAKVNIPTLNPPGTSQCESASIKNDKTSVKVGDLITFTLSRAPATADVTGSLMKNTVSGYVHIDTCLIDPTDSSGNCKITWTPTSNDVGTQHFIAHFPGCDSEDIPAQVYTSSPPAIVVTNISISPTTVVIVGLKNDGDYAATEFVFLKSDGYGADSSYQTVGAKGTGTVTWRKIAGSSTGFAVGSHNICANTSSGEKCTSLTVPGDGAGCPGTNNCCTYPKYMCDGTSCVSDNCNGQGTLPAGCNGICTGQTHKECGPLTQP